MDKWQNIRHFKFSSVKNYNPNNFVFLVHAIDLPAEILSTYHLSILLKDYGDNYNSSQRIDLALDPQRIAEKELLSCTLVAKKGDKETLTTYKPFGFIIKCPVENVVMVSRSDLGTLYTHPDEVRQKYKDVVFPSFEDIALVDEYDSETLYARLSKELQDYKDNKIATFDEKIFLDDGGWNEILVDGTTIYGKVEIEGIFVNLGHFSMNDASYAQAVIDEAKKLERRLGVSLVYLPKKEYSFEDRPIEVIYNSYPEEDSFLEEISFTKNGKKYRLYVGDSDTPILQSSTNGMMKPMSGEDFALFSSEINKLSSEELLKHADLISQLPQIFESQQSNAKDASQLYRVLESRRPFVKERDDYIKFFDNNSSLIEKYPFFSDKKQHR